MKWLIALLSFSMVSCKQTPSTFTSGGAEAGWQSDSSDFFSVSFPASFSPSTFNMGNAQKVFPGLALKPKSKGPERNVGSLFVGHDSTHVAMLLRDGAETRIRDLKERGGNLIVPLHALPTKNGTCLGFVVADPVGDCPEGIKAPQCYPIGYAAHCETPFGKRFAVMAMLPTQTRNARLDPAAVEMAKTFDKILATLEFKKF